MKDELKRWPALVGGGLLNVALGTYYAWSVFVPALEREFGWNRSQTSLVSTIDMVTLASMFLLAGFLQSRIGPRTVATIGGLLFSVGLFLTGWVHSLPMLYLTTGVMVGTGLGFGYLAPITVGSKWFPDHRGLVNGLAIGIFAAGSGIFGPVAGALIERIGWRATFQALAGLFFLFTMVGAYLLKDPPAGYEGPARKTKQDGQARRASRHADVAGASDRTVLRSVDRLCAGHDRGHDGDQSVGAVRPGIRIDRAHGGVRDHDRRDWQRDRAVLFRLDVRPLRASAHVADDRGYFDDCYAVAVFVARGIACVLCAAVFRLLLLWNAAIRLYRARGRLLGYEVSGDKLWHDAAGVGLCRGDGTGTWLARLCGYGQLCIRVLRVRITGLRGAGDSCVCPCASTGADAGGDR